MRRRLMLAFVGLVAGVLVIASETFAVLVRFPCATTFMQMSRSVMMPSSFRSSQSFTTGMAPTSCSFISCAAFWRVSIAAQQESVLLMMSCTFMRPPLARAVTRPLEISIPVFV